jgi:hypothetical protein
MNKNTKLAVGALALLSTVAANAQTDIAAVLTSVTGYQNTAIGIGVTILLFVVGRGIVRKLAK